MQSDSEEKTAPNVYLPRLPSIGSKNIDIYQQNQNARINLVTQLAASGMNVEDIDGSDSWLKNMLKHAEKSDAFIFPPMTSLPKTHKNYIAEAGQRWFEFFSVVTGVHVGNPEKYGPDGVSKPCVVMDPDNEWQGKAISLLGYLSDMGMFNSKVEDILQISPPPASAGNYHEMNHNAVQTLNACITERRGKAKLEIHPEYPPEHIFDPMRKDVKRSRFGVAFFGSATTKEQAYIQPTESLMEMVGQRGWRLVTGAGKYGCMGAADRGFEKGKNTYNTRYPNAEYKPAHVGVSTQHILRLEGPPPHLDQLIITDDIYERMKIMIRGQKATKMVDGEKIADKTQSSHDTVRVVFVGPGGTGTLHEFATMMQLLTHGNMMDERKIVLLNFPSHKDASKGFWDPLIEIAKELGFDKHLVVANTPEEAIKIADKEYQLWVERNPTKKDLPHPIFNPRDQSPL